MVWCVVMVWCGVWNVWCVVPSGFQSRWSSVRVVLTATACARLRPPAACSREKECLCVRESVCM